MSISRALKAKFDCFDLEQQDRIIRMAWEDRTSYEAITFQFALTPSELVHFMRYFLDEKSFKRWRRRILEQGKLKNSPHKNYRFKCKSQRMDGSTKNYK
ncbi:MAG: TIGR03643 family protein [Bacteriovoracaceae bacterium]|nr:TIGR03643 family protein [Bacteriovoracaceae bacterium]